MASNRPPVASGRPPVASGRPPWTLLTSKQLDKPMRNRSLCLQNKVSLYWETDSVWVRFMNNFWVRVSLSLSHSLWSNDDAFLLLLFLTSELCVSPSSASCKCSNARFFLSLPFIFVVPRSYLALWMHPVVMLPDYNFVLSWGGGGGAWQRAKLSLCDGGGGG